MSSIRWIKKDLKINFLRVKNIATIAECNQQALDSCIGPFNFFVSSIFIT